MAPRGLSSQNPRVEIQEMFAQHHRQAKGGNWFIVLSLKAMPLDQHSGKSTAEVALNVLYSRKFVSLRRAFQLRLISFFSQCMRMSRDRSFKRCTQYISALGQLQYSISSSYILYIYPTADKQRQLLRCGWCLRTSHIPRGQTKIARKATARPINLKLYVLYVLYIYI